MSSPEMSPGDQEVGRKPSASRLKKTGDFDRIPSFDLKPILPGGVDEKDTGLVGQKQEMEPTSAIGGKKRFLSQVGEETRMKYLEEQLEALEAELKSLPSSDVSRRKELQERRSGLVDELSQIILRVDDEN
ncbi:MAG: hypothetical protein V1664_00015 [Candidatus Uhrbacteria bacterium]